MHLRKIEQKDDVQVADEAFEEAKLNYEVANPDREELFHPDLQRRCKWLK